MDEVRWKQDNSVFVCKYCSHDLHEDPSIVCKHCQGILSGGTMVKDMTKFHTHHLIVQQYNLSKAKRAAPPPPPPGLLVMVSYQMCWFGMWTQDEALQGTVEDVTTPL